MTSNHIPEEVISAFCKQLIPGFHEARQKIEGLFPGSSDNTLAVNLMEFGRRQMSEVREPAEKDADFIKNYIELLDFDNADAAFFSAYSGGCILGLASINKLLHEDFSSALRLSEDFARDEFTGDAGL